MYYSVIMTAGMMTREVSQAGNQWIPTELKDMMNMEFRFEEKMDAARYATHLANNMQLYPPQHFITVISHCCYYYSSHMTYIHHTDSYI